MKNLKHLNMTFMTGALLACFIFTAEAGQPVKKELLGTHNGSEVYLFTLTNKNGNVLKVTNYGARIVRIEVPDRNGVKDNVTLGSETFDGIIKGDMFGGAVIGRFANRIANGKFTLDGKEYNLPVNNKPNTLHGGRNGWFSKVWNAEILQNSKLPAVKLSYTSPDMEEGFPGEVKMDVIYSWSDKNEIIIDYHAVTDKKTVINVTNHAYFNLHGAGKGYIFDHILMMQASAYTPFNNVKIPTGEIRPVKDTPFDFTTPRPIGGKIGETFENVMLDGYDHNFVLDNKKKVDATVYDPESGRFLEVITDQPGMQFYSGSGMAWKKAAASGTLPSPTRSGFALETQHFPDSPNQPGFPSTVLNPGDNFRSRTIYRFSVRK
ncbi:MAG TPA: aldose epimerase family protein [Bacteroidales bacterium]|nr:aldose epimerase family protein [Bacteroidales bacterium]HRR94288.1 aldose epimerase family protein [Bacteroidales bacterium]HRT88889.1 aldose epimerase family protein [Bacteroidales bacterium]